MEDTVRLIADAWKVMVGRLPTSRIEEGNGVTSCMGNVPLFFLNTSILERPAATQEELRSLLNIAVERAKTCEHPWGLIAREDWLPSGWEPLIAEAGLAPMMPMTDMETMELLPPHRPAANLDIRRVESDAAARDLAYLNAHAYHVPTELFDCIANMTLWKRDSLAYVGYADGKPVSCAAVFPVLGTVYLALVATSPEAQGKGYAAAVVRHTIVEGQKAMGTMHTTLHATDMGFPVYKAMGYKPGPRMIFMGPAH